MEQQSTGGQKRIRIGFERTAKRVNQSVTIEEQGSESTLEWLPLALEAAAAFEWCEDHFKDWTTT